MSLITDKINYSAMQYNDSIATQIAAICDPLKHLGISHFGCLKFFKDGSYLKLCNNPVWTKTFISNNLADKTTAFAEQIMSIPLSELKIKLWPKSKGNDCLSALYDYRVWNGIDLTIKHEDFIEVYYFGTKPENDQIHDFYINQVDLLIKFKAYFQEKAAHLLETTDKKRLAIQSNKVSLFTESTSPFVLKPTIDIDSFFNETSISKFYLSGKYPHIYLTRREMECLWYLSQGRTSKEMGRIMGLSFRTVDTYIINIKIKTGTHCKSQLIDIFLQSSLRNIFKNEFKVVSENQGLSRKING